MSDITVAVLAVQGAFIEHEKVLNKLGVNCIELRKKDDVLKDFDALVLPGGESTVQSKLIRELGMEDTLKEKILPARVKRNAYGRQLGSFYTEDEFKGIGKIPMTFIRAPYIEEVYDNTEVLSVVDGKIVAVENDNLLAVAFHPELNEDTRLHEYFLRNVK